MKLAVAGWRSITCCSKKEKLNSKFSLTKMGISAVAVTIKECINLLCSCPCSCDTVRMKCSDVKFHIDGISICLGWDFSCLYRFSCLHSRITGSGQLD